jgi:hypothetical protein
VAGLQLAGIPRRRTADQDFMTAGDELDHPVLHHLQLNVADPSRLRPRAPS